VTSPLALDLLEEWVVLVSVFWEYIEVRHLSVDQDISTVTC